MTYCLVCNTLFNIKYTDYICGKCTVEKFISIKDATKKYKLTEQDLYNYFCVCENEISIFGKYGKIIKYLISDIEKIAELKHTTINGKKFLENIKRTDKIEIEFCKLGDYIHNHYCNAKSDIYYDIYFDIEIDADELEYLLWTDTTLDVTETFDKFYASCKKKEILSKIVDDLIINTVCKKQAIVELIGLPMSDFEVLHNNSPTQIFNELTHTSVYEQLKHNFNYDIFNEVTILKVSFTELFQETIRQIIKGKINYFNMISKQKKFKNLVDMTVKNRSSCKKYVHDFDKIKELFLSNENTQDSILELLKNLGKKINNKF